MHKYRHKYRHIACTVHAGLGVSKASGSPSGTDRNIHKCPQAKSVYDGAREDNRKGLFNWWWVGKKQRQDKMRDIAEWRKKSMRSSKRNDDAGGNRMKNNRYCRWTGKDR